MQQMSTENINSINQRDIGDSEQAVIYMVIKYLTTSHTSECFNIKTRIFKESSHLIVQDVIQNVSTLC